MCHIYCCVSVTLATDLPRTSTKRHTNQTQHYPVTLFVAINYVGCFCKSLARHLLDIIGLASHSSTTFLWSFWWKITFCSYEKIAQHAFNDLRIPLFYWHLPFAWTTEEKSEPMSYLPRTTKKKPSIFQKQLLKVWFARNFHGHERAFREPIKTFEMDCCF